MLLKIAEAAERLSCSPQNVRNMIDAGKLFVVPVGARGAGLRIEDSEIERYIRENRELRGRVASVFATKTNPVKLKHLR
jgi:excisionase family DNA binding protein